MFRKNITFIFILFAWLSCSEEIENPAGEQDLPENAIGFADYQAADGSLRSAGDVTTGNISDMAVYAHYTGTTDFASVADASKPNFMFGTSVAKSNGAWTYSPVKYWPAPTKKSASSPSLPRPERAA
jgi:hypothetical protein